MAEMLYQEEPNEAARDAEALSSVDLQAAFLGSERHSSRRLGCIAFKHSITQTSIDRILEPPDGG